MYYIKIFKSQPCSRIVSILTPSHQHPSRRTEVLSATSEKFTIKNVSFLVDKINFSIFFSCSRIHFFCSYNKFALQGFTIHLSDLLTCQHDYILVTGSHGQGIITTVTTSSDPSNFVCTPKPCP